MKTINFKALLLLSLPTVLVATVVFIYVRFNLNFTNYQLILIGLALLILSLGYLNIWLKKTNRQVQILNCNLEKVLTGKFSDIEYLGNSGLLDLSLTNQHLSNAVDYFKKSRFILEKIASDELDTEFSDQHNLFDKQLYQLQNKLVQDKLSLEKSRQIENQRSWVAEGLARFGEIMRTDTENMHEFGYAIVSNLIDYIQFNQGAIYGFDTASDDETNYRALAAVAYGRRKILDKSFGIGEGLIGRCAYEKRTIYLTDIPKDYINITSGLGDAPPNTVLIVPCIENDKVYGIIEVASFNSIEEYQIEFIEKLGESIASTLSDLRKSQQTQELLIASQHQSEELAAQEEELRQNLEEMEATQEELKRQMDANAEMRETLKFEKFLFDTLLEKSPVRVNFKDRERRYIKASKSLVEKFGKSSYEEIVGLTDHDFFDHDFAEKTKIDDNEIMQSGKARINFIEHETHADGKEVWKNVSKIPLMDENNKCIGIFAMVSDITEFKMKEIENKKLQKQLKECRNLLV